ncbi:MAG: DedA family protein [Candidatus Muirbacterium halophilum]|nr:DedA family protein [Candidatus Muirbacterium halophilum]MCK9474455.1 DedA family protein [Candidatus Muirbacterium halophilum]
MLHSMIEFIVLTVEKLGYPGIIIMMFLESSFFPFPSEVVMPPAGYLASIGKMNIYIVILCGITGSLMGAVFNYYIAFFLGRPFIIKFGKYFFITEENFAKTEKYLNEHGEIGTFIGRLIPVIRQYISFPAGLIKMNIAKFSIFTSLGAGIWVLILTIIGYIAGSNMDIVHKYSSKATLFLMIFCTLIAFIYIWRKKNVQRHNNSCSQEKQ